MKSFACERCDTELAEVVKMYMEDSFNSKRTNFAFTKDNRVSEV